MTFMTATVIAALAGGLVAFAQGGALSATSPRKGGNPDAARLASPVPDTAETRSAGRRTYQRLCARCHGVEGKGDGSGAGAGGQPADFTDTMWIFGASAGEVFTVIRDGTSADMEGYAERLTEAEMWSLVHYIRSLSGDARGQ
ncbi:MAG: cytochrome c [Vicinamibacterales bacterium]